MTTIDLTTLSYLNNPSDPTSFTVLITPTDDSLDWLVGTLFNFPGFIGPLNPSTSTFPDFTSAINFYIGLYGSSAIVPYLDSLKGTSGSTLGTLHNNVYQSELDLFNLKVDKTTTVNGHPLSANVDIMTTDITDYASATDARIIAKLNALVGSAPGTLDTLQEIDNAINNDPNFATTLTTALAGKQPTITPGSASQYIKGDLTLGTLPTVLTTSIAGLDTSTSSTITSSDTVLSAFGKLQAQVTNALNGLTRTTSSITPSLVGTGATGTQISSTKASSVHVWLSESVTSSIGGAAIAAINIKMCATNNATEASWTSLGVFEEDQTVTLAIALQSVQVMKGMITFDLPAGWWWKAESSGSGTNSEGILGGQQTIYG